MHFFEEKFREIIDGFADEIACCHLRYYCAVTKYSTGQDYYLYKLISLTDHYHFGCTNVGL